MECVNAAGAYTDNLIIYKGKQHQLDWYGADTPHTAHAVTPSGWINDKVALEWMKKLFEPKTQPADDCEWRLLLMNGHYSHVTYELAEYSQKNRILAVILPAHSGQHLQPLDVGIFGPLASCYSSIMDSLSLGSQLVLGITKDNVEGILEDA